MLPNNHTLYRNNKSIKMNISEIIVSHESWKQLNKETAAGL